MQHGTSIESLPTWPLASRIGAAVVVRTKRVLILFAVVYATVFLLWLALWLTGAGADPNPVCDTVRHTRC